MDGGEGALPGQSCPTTGAVAAGGAWRRLLEQQPDDVPAVTKVWRQSAKEVDDMGEALAKWRADDVEGAIDVLRRHAAVWLTVAPILRPSRSTTVTDRRESSRAA